MIISLSSERERRDRPDPRLSSIDSQGETVSTFSATYRGPDGRRFGITILARDFDDAKRHVESIRSGLSLDLGGQVFEEIEA